MSEYTNMPSGREYLGSLDGLRVIEFSHYYAGPMAGMLLADQGAEVIRIVRPGPIEIDEKKYLILNRNKKILKLDLKDKRDADVALKLVENADVLIENFRPGVMNRLGFDYSAFKEANPGLVYLSLPGFPSNDKKRAHIQAWEGVISAAAGIFTHMGRHRQSLNFPPVHTPVPLCSAYASLHGVQSVMAALIARQRNGSGTLIEVPLVDAGLSALSGYFVYTPLMQVRSTEVIDEVLPEVFEKFVFERDDSAQVQIEKLKSAARAAMSSPFYIEPKRCADGRHLVICLPDKPVFIERFLKALGIEKQLKHEGFLNDGPWVTGIDNNISNDAQLSSNRRARLTQLVTSSLLTRTALEWEDILAGIGVTGIMVRTRDEWLALEPLLRSGLFTQINLDGAVLTMPGRLVDVSGPNGELLPVTSKKPVPVDLSQLQNLLTTRPRSATAARLLKQKKGDLLKGLKVLDLSSVLAGPTGSYYLAQYGADVIRLEPPDGVNGPSGMDFGEISQGKRTILVDVKTVPGQEVFRRLVTWADVLIHNCLDDVAKRLGVTHEKLKSINPKIVSCQMSGFGATYRGGWENRPGYDSLAQSACGIIARFGTLDDPHYHAMTASADMLSGIAIAYACLLAVYQQREAGVASEGRTSLARVINHVQLPYMIAENGISDQGEPRGQFAVGANWWQRIYACSDGWIYIGTIEDRASVLAEVVGEGSDPEETALETVFAGQTCAYWIDKLDKSQVACHKVLTLTDILRSQPIRPVDNGPADETANGPLEVLIRPDYPSGISTMVAAPTWVRIGEEKSYRRLAPTPRMGGHTREILQELSYDDSAIEELIRLKVAHEFHPGVGTKDAFLFKPEAVKL